MHPVLALPALSLAATFAAGAVLAQQTKVVPPGMDFVEGPAVFTYPFGRTDGAIAMVIDAERVTLGQGAISGIRFRQSRVTAAQTYAAYTKSYRVTAYTVTTTAASMVADLATNVGTAQGTVVFQGPLNVPAVVAGQAFPHPFAIQIPFTPQYFFDGTLGNLLLHVETADTNVLPTSYRIDAINFVSSAVTGIVADLDIGGCVANGNGLTLTANAAQAVTGGAIATTLTSSGNGAFPLALSCLSLAHQEQDLAPLGMAGCRAWLGPLAFQLATENAAGGYPAVTWAIPANPAFEGVAVTAQVFGIAPSTALADCVTSNGLAVRIGAAAPPVKKSMCAFRSGTGWFMGGTGEFMPVIQLDGVFP